MATKLQLAMRGADLTPAQREAVMSCFEVGYEGCPEEVAAVLAPLMEVETRTRAQRLIDAGIHHSPLAKASDEARERCGCPYVAMMEHPRIRGKVQLAMMVATDGGRGTLLKAFSDPLSEADAIARLEALTKQECEDALRGLSHSAIGRKEAMTWQVCAERVRRGCAG